jgi:hypothetical protein
MKDNARMREDKVDLWKRVSRIVDFLRSCVLKGKAWRRGTDMGENRNAILPADLIIREQGSVTG